MSNIEGDSIFWIETEKIDPNPYQPRREFNEGALKDLADSIRMYGVLQPLVVTRMEITKEDGGIATRYELISGERRLRASRIAGLAQIPAIIRTDADDARLKLELSIIENLQREDLNPVDRARSFDRLAKEFDLKHVQIAAKIGKSREYVSNCMRLLTLSDEILQALSEGKITEGHARPLMMLCDRLDEQTTLFKEIMFRKITVREAEMIARKIALDKVRKKSRSTDPEVIALEKKLAETLGTRVEIEHKHNNGGRIVVNFFSDEDFKSLLTVIGGLKMTPMPEGVKSEALNPKSEIRSTKSENTQAGETKSVIDESPTPIDDRPEEEIIKDENDGDLYSVTNFTV